MIKEVYIIDKKKTTCSPTWHAIDKSFTIYRILDQTHFQEASLAQNQETAILQNLTTLYLL